MATKQQTDAVDAILAQWHRERPDLDVSPMATIGRVTRCAVLLQRKLENAFSIFGITSWEFDVLATLRRSGAPHCLAPTTLFSTLMITSGTMTHRLQRLENAGWILRVANDKDARSMLVQLTPAGLELIERAVEFHVENEHRILSAMKPEDLTLLNSGLSKLLLALEGEG